MSREGFLIIERKVNESIMVDDMEIIVKSLGRVNCKLALSTRGGQSIARKELIKEPKILRFDNFPFPPMLSELFINHPKKGRVKSEIYKHYIDQCNLFHLQYSSELRQMKKIIWSWDYFSLNMRFYCRKSRLWFKNGNLKKFDADNLLKASVDQFCNIIERDDKFAFKITTEKVPIHNSGFERVEIVLMPHVVNTKNLDEEFFCR